MRESGLGEGAVGEVTFPIGVVSSSSSTSSTTFSTIGGRGSRRANGLVIGPLYCSVVAEEPFRMSD